MLTIWVSLPHNSQNCYWMLIGKHLNPVFYDKFWIVLKRLTGTEKNSMTSLREKVFYFSGKRIIKGKASKQSMLFILGWGWNHFSPQSSRLDAIFLHSANIYQEKCDWVTDWKEVRSFFVESKNRFKLPPKLNYLWIYIIQGGKRGT